MHALYGQGVAQQLGPQVASQDGAYWLHALGNVGAPLKNFSTNVGEAANHLKELASGGNPASQPQANVGPAAVQGSAANFGAGLSNASERLSAQASDGGNPASQPQANVGPAAVQGSPSNDLMLPPYSSPRPSRNKPPGPLMAPAALVRPAAS